MAGRDTFLQACPECGSHNLGRIAQGQFFCRQCCVELNLRPKQGRVDVFAVDEQGQLVEVGRRKWESSFVHEEA